MEWLIYISEQTKSPFIWREFIKFIVWVPQFMNCLSSDEWRLGLFTYIYQSLHFKPYSSYCKIYVLILDRVIDTCSTKNNFMEFNVMLEKCQLQMVTNHKIETCRIKVNRQSRHSYEERQYINCGTHTINFINKRENEATKNGQHQKDIPYQRRVWTHVLGNGFKFSGLFLAHSLF
jgi:hypothetical protein